MADTVQPAQPFNADSLRTKFISTVHDHWRLFLIEGIALIVLGFLAVVVAPFASLAVTIFIGWLFLIGGVVSFVVTLFGHRMPGFLWSFLSAAIAILAGGVLIWWPLRGVMSLTLVLSAFFILDGVMSIMYAIEHRCNFSKTWGWIMASGIVDLLLAGLIISGLPGSATWAIGLIVGINFMFGGSSLVAVALHARTAKP
jgi:uncharacterized membrane protein HdeD (DUF308 family)